MKKVADQQAEIEILKLEAAKERVHTRSNSSEVRELTSQVEMSMSKCKVLEMEIARLQASKQTMAASLEATASLQGISAAYPDFGVVVVWGASMGRSLSDWNSALESPILYSKYNSSCRSGCTKRIIK